MGQPVTLAAEAMSDPERAPHEKVLEQLHLGEATSTPMPEALGDPAPPPRSCLHSGRAVRPSTEPWAIWTSFAVAMVSIFVVGAGMKCVHWPGACCGAGMDMFLVGLGVAAVGYVLGDWIVRIL